MITIAKLQLTRMLKDKTALMAILLAPCLIILLVYLLTRASAGTSTLTIAYLPSDETTTFVEVMDSSPRYVFEEVSASNDAMSANYDAFLSFDKTMTIASTSSDIINELTPTINYFINRISDQAFIDWLQTSVTVNTIYNENAVNPLIGFIINYMMFSMVYIINEVILLRDQGIIRRLYSFSYHGLEIMMGVFLSMIGLLLIQVVFINITLKLCFDIYLFTSLWSALPLSLAYSAVIIGLGLTVARYLKKPEFSALVANFIVMPLGIISGTFLPESMLPDVISGLRFISPQYWLFQGFGYQASDVLMATIVLTLMGVLTTIISGLDFRRMIANIA